MKRCIIILLLSLAPSVLWANGEWLSFHVLKSSDLQKIFDARDAAEKRVGPRAFKKMLADASLFSGTPGTIDLDTKDYSYHIATQITPGYEGTVWFDIRRWNSDKSEEIHCTGSGSFPRTQAIWIKPNWQKDEHVVVFYRIVAPH